jgi:hypothetical protein
MSDTLSKIFLISTLILSLFIVIGGIVKFGIITFLGWWTIVYFIMIGIGLLVKSFEKKNG